MGRILTLDKRSCSTARLLRISVLPSTKWPFSSIAIQLVNTELLMIRSFLLGSSVWRASRRGSSVTVAIGGPNGIEVCGQCNTKGVPQGEKVRQQVFGTLGRLDELKA